MVLYGLNEFGHNFPCSRLFFKRLIDCHCIIKPFKLIFLFFIVGCKFNIISNSDSLDRSNDTNPQSPSYMIDIQSNDLCHDEVLYISLIGWDIIVKLAIR